MGDEDDPCIEPAVFMKRNIPTSGLVAFPQTGRTLNLEEPELFNHTVQHFFSAVEEGRWVEYDPNATGEYLIDPKPGDLKPR